MINVENKQEYIVGSPFFGRVRPTHNTHRIIRTVEEVRALPDGAVVMTRYGSPVEVHQHSLDRNPAAYDWLVDSEEIDGIADFAIVLLEGPLEQRA